MIFRNCEDCRFYYDITEYCEEHGLEGNDKVMYGFDDEAEEMVCTRWHPREGLSET